MQFTINMTCDNAAFEDNPEREVARILRNLAQTLRNGPASRFYETIFDVNGNDVGWWRLK